MARSELIFIECQRCGRKAQRVVPWLPLPAGTRFRCSNCGNREMDTIKTWSTAGSSSARVISFPRGNSRR